jgi:hypothetical protein
MRANMGTITRARTGFGVRVGVAWVLPTIFIASPVDFDLVE